MSPAGKLANRISDRMNAAVPWLWWPLDPPAPGNRLGPPEHALYAIHGAALWLGARRLGARIPASGAVGLGAASWLWFTRAWNRRAEALAAERAQSLR